MGERLADGYAFPGFHPKPPGEPDLYCPGMTLRDYFAGQAIVALINSDFGDSDELTLDQRGQMYAGFCYHVADAMLAERERDGS